MAIRILVWATTQRTIANNLIVCQTAATSSSSSLKKTCSAKPSAATDRPAAAPPAKGSTNTEGVILDAISHLRTSGTSQVLPPGYRNGLSWRTCATFVGAFLSWATHGDSGFRCGQTQPNPDTLLILRQHVERPQKTTIAAKTALPFCGFDFKRFVPRTRAAES